MRSHPYQPSPPRKEARQYGKNLITPHQSAFPLQKSHTLCWAPPLCRTKREGPFSRVNSNTAPLPSLVGKKSNNIFNKEPTMIEINIFSLFLGRLFFLLTFTWLLEVRRGGRQQVALVREGYLWGWRPHLIGL